MMKFCINIFDIVPPTQSTVVLFSKGSKFEFDAKGSGETGNWKVDPDRLKKIEKVVVYLRKPNASGGRIFIGDFTGFVPSEQIGRHIITFSRLDEVCETKANWSSFANTGSSPVRYI